MPTHKENKSIKAPRVVYVAESFRCGGLAAAVRRYFCMVRSIVLCFALLILSCTGKKQESNTTERSQQSTGDNFLDTTVLRQQSHFTMKDDPFDTTIMKQLSLFPIEGNLRLVNHLFGRNWEKTTYWTICIVKDSDTLISNTDSSSYFDWELENDISVGERASIIAAKKKYFFSEMTKLDIDTVNPLDDRRDYFKKISLSEFLHYYRSRGYSDDQIHKFHSYFWQYYEKKKILIFAMPNPNPPNELAYAFDPNSKEIIPFYAP